MQAGAERPNPSTTVTGTETAFAPAPNRPWQQDTIAILGITLLVLLLAYALVWPWLSKTDLTANIKHRYQPLYHGQVAASVSLDANGELQSWMSDNAIAIPALD